ncbi:MAG: hypothetical protein IJH12_07195 [Clostridia bacterium]|nr:hypothetical protein [Clostridia bacterium]
MKSTIEKALEANICAGFAERITIDGVTFSRLPLLPNMPVLEVSGDWRGPLKSLEEAKEKAELARKFLAESGLTWHEVESQYSPSDPFHSNVHGEIWSKCNSVLVCMSDVFRNEPKCNGIWSISDDYDPADYMAIYPSNASHMLIAEYFPSREDVKYLRELRYMRHDYVNDIRPDSVFFLDVDNWDIKTKHGIITLKEKF